tara:strand:- start:151 stop:768 length:618 start_codon:yes stop_codon:yes gene_type:complete
VKKISLIKPLLEVIEPVIIVGNSSSILNEKRGKEIDNFNTVIRFNDFKTENFIEYTGSKTSLNFISNSYFNFYDLSNQNFKIIIVDNSYRISEKEIIDKNYFKCDDYSSTILRYKYGPFVNFLRTSDSKGTWLNLLYPKNITLGLLVTLIMVENSIKPTLHGIDLNHNSVSHYYKNTKNHNQGHSYFYEKKILSRLKKQDKINYL